MLQTFVLIIFVACVDAVELLYNFLPYHVVPLADIYVYK